MRASEIRAEARYSLNGQWGKAILSIITYILTTFLISFVLAFIPFIGVIANYIISVPLSIGLISIFLKIAKREDYKYFDFLNVTMQLFGRAWGIVFGTLLKMWKPILLLIVSIIIIVVNMSTMLNSSMLSAAQSAADRYNAAVSGLDSVSTSISSTPSRTFAPVLSLLSTVLMVVSVFWIFAKGLLYSLSNFILVDNPNMTTKAILEKSESLMTGNRLKLIFLQLSFIGWVLLIYAILLFVPFVLVSLIGVSGGAIITYLVILIGLLLLSIYMQTSTVCFYKRLASEKE